MESPLQAAKTALRKRLREGLSRISPADRAVASRALCRRLREQPVWVSAKRVMLFAPTPQEVNIWSLVEEALTAGKTVALPRFSPVTQTYTAAIVRDLRADLRAGKLGIREPLERCEPVPMNRLDLILVPGLGFDPRGRRLGRGKGFYDRLLADAQGVKCGVAFDEQVVVEVPVGPQDARLDCILTPSRWLEC
jgi:5-formyltetrahydrofolate cyclo-ligase